MAIVMNSTASRAIRITSFIVAMAAVLGGLGAGEGRAQTGGDEFASSGREDLCPPCDGLAGRPQIMPKASGPWGYACVPPVPEWEVIGEKGNYCCYFARYEHPIQGEIVTRDQAGVLQHMREVSLAGGSCGSNLCDPEHRTFICQGPGIGGDVFSSSGGAPTGPGPGSIPGPSASGGKHSNSVACGNNPRSYTCMYGHDDVIASNPEEKDVPGSPSTNTPPNGTPPTAAPPPATPETPPASPGQPGGAPSQPGGTPGQPGGTPPPSSIPPLVGGTSKTDWTAWCEDWDTKVWNIFERHARARKAAGDTSEVRCTYSLRIWANGSIQFPSYQGSQICLDIYAELVKIKPLPFPDGTRQFIERQPLFELHTALRGRTPSKCPEAK